ncbi:MAG TPA: hypothetical protein VGC53_16265 [Vicinamibacteria bacterium]
MGTSNLPAIPAGMLATLQISIKRWTTDEERELFAVLIEKGRKSS